MKKPLKNINVTNSQLMKPINLLVIALLAFTYVPLTAQQANNTTQITQQYLQLTPTIPTPNVASFTKYGEYPVSEYTGIPDITIPVYTLKDGKVEMPITLRYNASGLKVEEQSDWIGLGWNLNVGGQITHIVIGQDDELCYDTTSNYFTQNAWKAFKTNPNQPYMPFVQNYMHYSTNYFSTLMDGPSNYPQVMQSGQLKIPTPYMNYDTMQNGLYAPGCADTYGGPFLDQASEAGFYEPDLYTFNFLNYSGKFLMHYSVKYPLGLPVMINGSAPFKIEPILTAPQHNGSYAWKITTDNGIVAYLTEPQNKNSSTTMPLPNAPTTFLLHKLVYPGGDSIVFSYTEKRPLYPVRREPQMYENYYMPNGGTPCAGMPGTILPNQIKNVGNPFVPNETYNPKYISQITSENFTIQFALDSNRLDLPGEDKLDSIIVSCKTTGSQRVFKFDNNWYFGNNTPAKDSLNKRLQLRSFCESTNPPYVFSYDTVNNLPSKLSCAVDYWGYYNGQTANSYLLPDLQKMLKFELSTFVSGFILGSAVQNELANRGPDSASMHANMLTKIVYPSGGYTQFYFEPNRYSNFYYEKAIPNSVTIELGSNQTPPWTYQSQTFTVPTAQSSIFSWGFNNDNGGTTLSDINGMYVELISMANDDTIKEAPSSNNGHQGNQITVNLLPGEYKIVSNTPSDCVDCANNTYLSFNLKDLYPMGGGERIRSIENFDSNNVLLGEKIYQYETATQSHGKLMSGLKFYKYRFYNDIYQQYNGNVKTTDPYIYGSILENSNIALSTDAAGSFVGYDTVTIINRSQTANGYVQKRFVNVPSIYDGYTNMPNVPNLTNGQPLFEFYYDNNNNLLKSTYYSYQNVQDTFFYGFTSDYCCWTTPYAFELPYHMNAYIIPASMYRTSSISTTDYLNGQPLSTSVSYQYNILGQQKRISETTSDGRLKNTFLQYPYDLKNTLSTRYNTLMDTLIHFNYLSPVINQWDSLGTASTGYKKCYFKKFTYDQDTFFGPIRIAQYLDTRSDSIIANYEYDPTNLLIREAHLSNGIHTTFLWGYNHTFPIAKVTNSDTTQVYYTSFEDNGVPFTDANGNNLAKTGQKVYQGVFSFPSTFQPNVSNTLMSYWYYNGTKWIFSGELPYSSNINQSGAIYLDEVRAYPIGSRMTTYTYDPLYGMTTQTDENNETTYYSYDDLGRLILIRDKDNNILKTYQYHYQGQ